MKVFTTGQVAKICKVAPRTVSKWFDSGRLKGYRIPGSQDRRIPREYLIKFLKEHGMPLGDLEDEAMAKVLIVAQDQVLIENLKRELPPERSFKVGVAASGFEAGIQAESFNPDCIIVDFSIGKVEALQICQNLRRNTEFADMRAAYDALDNATAIGDFNGDRVPDVAVTNTGVNTVSVLLGVGDGSFGPHEQGPDGADRQARS